MERRYIARVVGTKPEIIETRTDYLVTVPRSRKAFLVTMNPTAETVVGRRTAFAVVRKAQEKDLPVLYVGRSPRLYVGRSPRLGVTRQGEREE